VINFVRHVWSPEKIKITERK